MNIDTVLLSDDYLKKIRRDVEQHLTATSGEVEIQRAANLLGHIAALELASVRTPVPMRLTCPTCNTLHVDEGEFATKPHHTHACQHCGNVWRPAIIATVGVQFLPGFKNGGAR